ncbi:MAG: asparagine synthase (glutamine-hydrolyzing), partial [Planctomycetota bacterium]|nr:asparagine synthase (glutamine-hydrolyzing) [Planctomycetota bacterium]
MCGFAGFVEPTPARSRDASERLIRQMADRLTHRGPDDSGCWLNESGTVALGHRRLAVLDTSLHGHQPMTSPGGRFVLAYNGEVYNHQELRRDLQHSGVAFRGQSDTETLVAAFSSWGIRDTIERCIGMFAMAVWDTQDHSLTLIRDRLGIKPLYYGLSNGCLLFGSELKALRAHPAFNAELNRGAISRFLQHSYVPAPHTVYSNFRKLPAGCLLKVQNAPAKVSNNDLPQPEAWWDARSVAEAARDVPFAGSFSEATNQLEATLTDAVQMRMLSDVPLGAFLSGGIDSSLVCALMQKQSSRPVQTFTIGFEETDYNEANHAKRIAEHLGTEHTEYYVTSNEARDVIPRLPEMYDEPFSDSSQIPTFLVSQLARKHVTVALSGDGGDELFGGYNRYFEIRKIWQMINRIPGRRLASKLFAISSHLLSGRWKEPFRHRANLLGLNDATSLYQIANLHWRPDDALVLNSSDTASTYWNSDAWLRTGNSFEEWMWLDTVTYLPDDILTKVDRASMAVSLEVRVPVIDHRVFEFAWSLPFEMKAGTHSGKLILQELLSRHVPRAMFERPKMGFGVPINDWLRGPLRDWAESLLDENKLREQGLLNPGPIRQKWNEHQAGTTNWHYALWDVLMLQAWL